MDFIKIERKEMLMEQIKKVKIVTKMTLLSLIQTLWAIGTSVVAGDVLTQRLKSTNRQHMV
jgi:hypothetical protein